MNPSPFPWELGAGEQASWRALLGERVVLVRPKPRPAGLQGGAGDGEGSGQPRVQREHPTRVVQGRAGVLLWQELFTTPR